MFTLASPLRGMRLLAQTESHYWPHHRKSSSTCRTMVEIQIWSSRYQTRVSNLTALIKIPSWAEVTVEYPESGVQARPGSCCALHGARAAGHPVVRSAFAALHSGFQRRALHWPPESGHETALALSIAKFFGGFQLFHNSRQPAITRLLPTFAPSEARHPVTCHHVTSMV
jgi:hypothetical protein